MVSVRHESEPGKSFEHFHEVFEGDRDGNDDVDVITIITTILTTMRMLMPRLTLVRPGGSTVGWPCSKGTTPGILMVTVMIMMIMMVMMVTMKMSQFVPCSALSGFF